MAYGELDAQWFVVHQRYGFKPGESEGEDGGLVVFCSRSEMDALAERIPGCLDFLNCGSDLGAALEHAASVYEWGDIGAPFMGRTPTRFRVEFRDVPNLMAAKDLLPTGRLHAATTIIEAGEINSLRMLAMAKVEFTVTPMDVAKAPPLTDEGEAFAPKR